MLVTNVFWHNFCQNLLFPCQLSLLIDGNYYSIELKPFQAYDLSLPCGVAAWQSILLQNQDRSNGNQGGPTQRASALAALSSAFNPSSGKSSNSVRVFSPTLVLSISSYFSGF